MEKTMLLHDHTDDKIEAPPIGFHVFETRVDALLCLELYFKGSYNIMRVLRYDEDSGYVSFELKMFEKLLDAANDIFEGYLKLRANPYSKLYFRLSDTEDIPGIVLEHTPPHIVNKVKDKERFKSRIEYYMADVVQNRLSERERSYRRMNPLFDISNVNLSANFSDNPIKEVWIGDIVLKAPGINNSLSLQPAVYLAIDAVANSLEQQAYDANHMPGCNKLVVCTVIFRGIGTLADKIIRDSDLPTKRNRMWIDVVCSNITSYLMKFVNNTDYHYIRFALD